MSALPAPVGLDLATIPVSLLKLPPELLLEVLRDAPWSVRPTCCRFRCLLDSDRRTLSLRPPHGAGPRRQLQHLTSLLRRLPRLTALHAGTFEFATLPFLPTACPTLESLTLLDAHIRSNDALALLWACRRLTSLNVSGCRFLTSLRALWALTALKSLDIGGCKELTSIAPLVHCPHITALTLGVAVTSLRPLTALHALASLTSSNCAIHDFSPLASAAASLTRLHFSHTGTADLPALLTCTRLVSLKMQHAHYVLSLDPLLLFGRALTSLHLHGTRVTKTWNPSPHAPACPTLPSAAARASPLAALSSLRPTLTSRNLSSSPVADVTPLSALTALTHLDLGWTGCATAAALAACTRLRTLRVGHCHIPAAHLHALAQALPDMVLTPAM